MKQNQYDNYSREHLEKLYIEAENFLTQLQSKTTSVEFGYSIIQKVKDNIAEMKESMKRFTIVPELEVLQMVRILMNQGFDMASSIQRLEQMLIVFERTCACSTPPRFFHY